MRTLVHTIGKVTIMLAVAVVLLGGLGAPADVAAIRPGINEANEFILSCTRLGGEPIVVMDSTGENLTVYCIYPDGSTSVCQFLPVVKDCQWVTPLKTTKVLPRTKVTIRTK